MIKILKYAGIALVYGFLCGLIGFFIAPRGFVVIPNQEFFKWLKDHQFPQFPLVIFPGKDTVPFIIYETTPIGEIPIREDTSRWDYAISVNGRDYPHSITTIFGYQGLALYGRVKFEGNDNIITSGTTQPGGEKPPGKKGRAFFGFGPGVIADCSKWMIGETTGPSFYGAAKLTAGLGHIGLDGDLGLRKAPGPEFKLTPDARIGLFYYF